MYFSSIDNVTEVVEGDATAIRMCYDETLEVTDGNLESKSKYCFNQKK